jgi:thiol:disulfide interchange protein
MKSLFLFFILFQAFSLKAQEKITLYNPDADARKDLETAIQTARDQHKHVLIQVGGNWCPWCVRLHGVFESEARIDSILKSDYVFVLINYSKENKNEAILADLGYPQRFGFPVLLVLDRDGHRLHTQNTAYLEKDKGYDTDKIFGFLRDWNEKALDPGSYVK